MTKHVWSIELDAQSHSIEFERGLWSTKHTIRVDGQVVHQGRSIVTDFGTDDAVQIGSHTCSVHTRSYWTQVEYDLSIDGLSITTQQPVAPRVPLPKWAWIFIIACLAIPLITLGGALAGVIGFGGAYICLEVARRATWQIKQRVIVSAGVAVIGYALLIGFLASTPTARTIFSAGQTNWQEFSSTAGGYSILMPGYPIEQTSSAQTATGSIELYTASDSSGDFVVSYFDYPIEILAKSNSQTLLDERRAELLASSQGSLISDQNLTLDTYPGREIQVRVPAQNGQSELLLIDRYFLAGARLYQTLAIIPNGQQISANAHKFLDSFKLLTR